MCWGLGIGSVGIWSAEEMWWPNLVSCWQKKRRQHTDPSDEHKPQHKNRLTSSPSLLTNTTAEWTNYIIEQRIMNVCRCMGASMENGADRWKGWPKRLSWGNRAPLIFLVVSTATQLNHLLCASVDPDQWSMLSAALSMILGWVAIKIGQGVLGYWLLRAPATDFVPFSMFDSSCLL